MPVRTFAAPCLLTLFGIQWILIMILLMQRNQQIPNGSGYTLQPPNRLDTAEAGAFLQIKHKAPLEGVAATIVFRAPKWFHLRYLVMLHNALVNLPKYDGSWKIQIFINEAWVAENLMTWHPGMRDILAGNDPRFLITPLSNIILQGKPKDILMSLWFWENVAAERVVLFSGNGAFCGNQPTSSSNSSSSWTELLSLDYCGVPWTNYDGIGGDGNSHSIRSRQGMLRVLQYAQTNKITMQSERQLVATIIRMNNDIVGPGTSPIRLASYEQTIQFGGVYNLSTPDGLQRLPLVVAGTQARLTWKERDSLLKHCPELRIIYPSLHEPACFGAHPDADRCKATICALQDNVPSHGC